MSEPLLKNILILRRTCSITSLILGKRLTEFIMKDCDSFKSTVGVRQGCILSPLLFNIYLEEIMSEVQDNLKPSISTGGRPVWTLKFADDIDLIAGTDEELQNMTNQLSKCACRYGMKSVQKKAR